MVWVGIWCGVFMVWVATVLVGIVVWVALWCRWLGEVGGIWCEVALWVGGIFLAYLEKWHMPELWARLHCMGAPVQVGGTVPVSAVYVFIPMHVMTVPLGV